MEQVQEIEEIRRDELGRFMVELISRRLKMVPVALVVVIALVVSEDVTWRKVVMLTSFLAVTAFAGYIALAVRRGADPGRLLPRYLIWMTTIQLVVVAVTGGVDSPIAFSLLFAPTFLALVASPRATWGMSLTEVALLIVLTWVQGTERYPQALPAIFGGGSHAGTATLVLMRGAVLGFVVLVWTGLMLRFRRAFEAITQRSARSRDDLLEEHAEQTRSLTTLAGEIAHELKNPLASIKGLGALLARGLEGKQAEQMAVLRREVDRMQGILDEFLNFSRPLVPLSHEQVRLGALCQDVALLHESVSLERRVRLSVEGDPTLTARCDRRKVKQILINLVQNALDASPKGAVVRIEIGRAMREAGPAVRLAVVDEGSGISPEIEARAFQPGVTSKPEGSGLGLTVSRALARQHGGELTLSSAGRGCVAELLLPLEVTVPATPSTTITSEVKA